ncbi:VCBS repeat-containing protein [Congregicoccus parvus]|uniref:VCBS repeat-containing protein n=1 Tax=Congregicoccus parvus TaxID=3081749 RepID=UPI003FA55482
MLPLLGVWLSSAVAVSLESVPLAAPTASTGSTLFTRVPAEQSGLVTENKYDDPRMWTDLFHEFQVGAIGTGVAIADYDGDGRPDVFVVSKTESCRLFRNLGDWRFEDVTARAGVADRGDAAKIWKQGATFADIDNDGRLDLYVCRFGVPNLLYVNQGDGTFREEAAARGLALVDASGMAAFCDYDRDGWLDVFIQTNLLDAAAQPDGRPDRLYRNNRDGTFTDVTSAAGIAVGGPTQVHSATWWDFDDDGWPDLYVANDFAKPDHLWRNNRDGTFTDIAHRALPHTPYSSMGADLGDIDNDGRVDFLVADMAATTHEKDQRGMAVTRARTIRDPVDSAAAGAPQLPRNTLFLATGTDRLQEAAHLTGLDATDWTWAVRFEDFDNDGRLDAFFTNGMFRELHNTDLLTRMMQSENARARVALMQNSPVLAEPNLAFRNLGDLRFESVGPAWGLDLLGVSFGAATGDLDGDGDLDLVVSNYRDGITVYRNDSTDGARVIIALQGTVSNRFGVGATVRVDSDAGLQTRHLVLARGSLSTSEPTLHFGLGNASVVPRLTVRWPSGAEQTFRDLPAGHRYTIVEPSTTATVSLPPVPPTRFIESPASAGFRVISREEFVDENAVQPLLPWRFDQRGPLLAVGDVDSDGFIDVVLPGTALEPMRLLHGRPGGFGAPVSLGRPLSPANGGPVLVFDADGDGLLDLLATRGGGVLPAGSPPYQPALLLNDGAGGFRPAAPRALPTWRHTTGAIAAADWDRDGDLDVFIGGRLLPGDYPMPAPGALWRNDGGNFTDVTTALAAPLREIGLVTAALWSDADADGWPDLLVALEWGEVRFLRNEQGRGFSEETAKAGFASAGTGWWQSLATADFNGDGLPDFAVGNLGLNTPYQPSAESPSVLYYGDFKGDDTWQILDAFHEDGRLLPRRSRRELGAHIPAILRRFPRDDAFARATLDELVGADRLARARKFVVTEARSGVFLSAPDRTWRFQPLPRIAQIAPINALAAADVDGDGHQDLVAAQNSHSPIPQTGRFEGGVGRILRGDGQGGFTAEPPARSGFVVPGDTRAVVIADLDADGRPDLLVARNRAPTIAFINRGTTSDSDPR